MSEATANVPVNLKARLKDSYDAIASHYNETFTQEDDPIRLGYLGRLLEHLKKGEKETAAVLELGCGGGIPGTKTLLQNEHPILHVTANDLSTTQVELAKQNLTSYSERLELIQGDMLQLSFPDASFDAVVGFYSVIHLPRDEQTALIKKIAKWLKPGGLLLVNLSEEEMEVAIHETWLEQDKGWMFWSGWGSEQSTKMIEDAGLEILVKEVKQAAVDAPFLWIIARKGRP